MRCLRLATLGLLFCAQAALADLPPLPFPDFFYYNEFGDAGDKFSPQELPGGPWFGIIGDIGGPDDTTDAFRFRYLGEIGWGPFGGYLDSTIPIHMTLWTGTGPLTQILPTFPADPCGCFTAAWVIPAGIYIVQFSTSADDPPYFFSSLGGPLFSPTAIPEPGTWVLMLIGLGGVVVMRRRTMRAPDRTVTAP